MPDKTIKDNLLVRLKKIEGQIKGIERMVSDEKYCIDIINQIRAASKALSMVTLLVMKGHINSCVADAIKKGKPEQKIDELVDAIYRFIK